jgi:hypothetical protein
MSEQRSEKRWEDRPGWACCFPPRNPRSEHPPDFTGVIVPEDHKKYWVNLYVKTDRNGNRFVSVNIKPVLEPARYGQAEPRPRSMKKGVRHGQYIP